GTYSFPGPRARSVQRHLLSDPGQVMRPGHGLELRSILVLVGFPEESVAFLNAPFAGRLLAGDVEGRCDQPPLPPSLPRRPSLWPILTRAPGLTAASKLCR